MSKTKWIIIEEYVYGDDNCCKVVGSQLFSEYEKAKARFDQLVADQKRGDEEYSNCPEDCIVDEPMEFSYYEDGYYNDNHYSLRLIAVVEDD